MPAVQLFFDFDVSDIDDTVKKNFHASRHEPVSPVEKKSIEHNRRVSFPRKTEYRPFGSWVSFTRRLTAFIDLPEEKNLDRYFVSRSIDNLKGGGTCALIVHPGVLENKSSRDWRINLSKKAHFLGAVKLNDRSFAHAHTSIQPDILVFQKHPDDVFKRLASVSPEEVLSFASPRWIDGTYFEHTPRHIMGELRKGEGQWGSDVVSGALTQDSLDAALQSFQADYPLYYDSIRDRYALPNETKEPNEPAETAENYAALTNSEIARLERKELAPGAVKTSGGSVYILTGDHRWGLAAGHNTPLAERLNLISSITQQVKSIRAMMRNGESAENHQKVARASLEYYKNRFEAYPKDDPVIRRFLKNHPAVSGIFEGLAGPKDDVLTTAKLYDTNGKLVDGHSRAVRALLALQEQMLPGTPVNIEKYFPDDAAALMEEMYEHPDIFLAPEGIWQLREDYISGNIWRKIDDITAHVNGISDPHLVLRRDYGKWVYGMAELEKAAGWIDLENAQFSPHASWIPEDIVNNWIADPNGLELSCPLLGKNPEGKWGAVSPAGAWSEHNDAVVYYLNMQKQRSRYTDTEIYNREHDESFRIFVTNHQEYRDRLEKTYNRLFNTEIAVPVKTYPVFLEGWQTASKSLKPHQWQTIHHLYRSQKGISALGTGFGKTLAAVGLHALLMQEGKITRSWFQVPNNKVKDWVKEIHAVFPGKTIGFIDTETPGCSNRETRYSRYQTLANSKFDIIIMPESAAGEIQLSPENDALITGSAVIQQLMDKAASSARQKQIAEDNINRNMQNGKTNRTITFEDFGCDAIFVDEAHRYKNLFSSNLSRETGMNDGRQSAKAMSLFKKTEYIRRQNQGKNIFLFTATPLTNSPLEYYNMLMYVAPEELQNLCINTIDSFIRNFADIRIAPAYDWKTGSVADKKVLTGFKNIQTLQNIFFKYTDYQNNPDKIGLDKPDAHNKPNVIPMNPKQTAVLQSLSEEMERYINTPTDKRAVLFPGQNFLTFYSKMRTASLDLELFTPDTYTGWENPKLNALAANARTLYQATGAGQVVFCDRVFSSDGSFNIHDKLKKSLVRQGFKDHEIIIVNGFTKSGGVKSDSLIEKEVSAAVDAYNRGKYKILIGSTACIGEGLNLQENSCALHHFDIPFRPSDFIQRNGRIDRQGNSQNRVELHTYMSAGTIDNYSVSLVQNKANWIDLLLKTKSNVFLNPNDESFINSEELLLALTEEWGDEQSVEKRREQLEQTKKEKLREAENNKRIELTKMLSLTRGLIHNYRGDVKDPAYMKRREKIKNIEKSLAANKTIKDVSILESPEPFLYAPARDMILHMGDVLLVDDKPFQINSFNFKNHSAVTKSLIKLPRHTFQDSVYRETFEFFSKQIPLNTIESDPDIYIIKKPSPEGLKIFQVLCTDDFYTFPDCQLKEQLYRTHLINGESSSVKDSVLTFRIKSDGNLSLEYNRYINSYSIREYLNPFSDHDIEAMREAANIGVRYEDETKKKDINAFLKNRLPDVYNFIRPKRQITPAVEDIIAPTENTAENFRQNIVKLKKSGFFPNNPHLAAGTLIKTMNEHHRQSVNVMLRSMGCDSPESTKKIINSWFLPDNHELEKKSYAEANR